MIILHLSMGLVTMLLPHPMTPNQPTLVAAPMETVAQMTVSDLPPVWQCIAFYESTDRLTAVNPQSGDQGIFQFALSTWREFAPPGYPAEPIEASLSEQFDVALKLWQAQGFNPWETKSLCTR